MTQPLYEFGGSGPVIHLALANGFPPQTYQPLLQPLTAHYRVVSLPPRGLWPGIGKPPEQPGSWRELTDDLLAGMREYNLRNVIAIGHSFGAVASLLAAIDEPERFHGLCLLDPTIFPLGVMQMMQEMKLRGENPRIPLAEGALARRSHFANVDEAFDYWRGKSLFQDWSDDVLRLYAESMTRPADDGDGLQLTWSGQWEAYYYNSFYVDTWDDLPRLNRLLPLLVVQGENTNAFVHESAVRMREILPDATYATIPGHGHLFPQSAPDATREIVEAWLKTI